jgi:hypothetical protein
MASSENATAQLLEPMTAHEYLSQFEPGVLALCQDPATALREDTRKAASIAAPYGLKSWNGLFPRVVSLSSGRPASKRICGHDLQESAYRGDDLAALPKQGTLTLAHAIGFDQHMNDTGSGPRTRLVPVHPAAVEIAFRQHRFLLSGPRRHNQLRRRHATNSLEPHPSDRRMCGARRG